MLWTGLLLPTSHPETLSLSLKTETMSFRNCFSLSNSISSATKVIFKHSKGFISMPQSRACVHFILPGLLSSGCGRRRGQPPFSPAQQQSRWLLPDGAGREEQGLSQSPEAECGQRGHQISGRGLPSGMECWEENEGGDAECL